jgi:cation diffusion facilitator family transporter
MKTTGVMITSFITNLMLSVIKIVIGFIGKSNALIADGIHSTSDLITDIVAIFGGIISQKPEDKEHPYGHGRLEYLTSVLIGCVVLAIGFTLIGNVAKTSTQIPSKFVIVVSVFTIICKFLLAQYLTMKGKKYDNQILIASGKESSADVYSSIIVFIASILMQLEAYFHPFIYADKIASIIVGIFIVKTGFSILKENINILIGSQDTDMEYYKQVQSVILKNKHIRSIDKLITMKYGYFYTLNIEVSMEATLSLKEAHDEIEKIEESLRKKNNRTKYIHIHMNPYIEKTNTD